MSTANAWDMTRALVHAPTSKAPRRVSDQEVEQACELLTLGWSVRAIAHHLGYPMMTLWKTLTSERHEGAYAHARALRGTLTGDALNEVNQALLDGKIDHNVGRVVSGNLQWLAARQDGKRWGDKQQVDVKAEVGLTINVRRMSLPE